MAKLIQVMSEFCPRIEHKGLIDTQQIIDDMAEHSSLSKGDVSSFLQDLGDVIIKYLREGNSVEVGGIGRFHLSVDVSGKINVRIHDDPRLGYELNKPNGFSGVILHKDMIGPDNAKVIEAWNKAHPTDPVVV